MSKQHREFRLWMNARYGTLWLNSRPGKFAAMAREKKIEAMLKLYPKKRLIKIGSFGL